MLGVSCIAAALRVAEKLQDVKHVLMVLSGKGGVGKSTFASQLAFTLAEQGKQVRFHIVRRLPMHPQYELSLFVLWAFRLGCWMLIFVDRAFPACLVLHRAACIKARRAGPLCGWKITLA